MRIACWTTKATNTLSEYVIIIAFLLQQWLHEHASLLLYSGVSQPPGRGPVPDPGINYTGPREILLELITNLNVILYLSACHTVHINALILFMIMPYLIINTYVSLKYELKKKLERY